MSVGTNCIGKPVSRIDGPAKVTGRAKYAAEFSARDLAYGFVVSSAVAKGRIQSIDRSAALAVPGVIEVFAHDNRPSLPSSHEKYSDEVASPGAPFRPLYDDEILFSGQPVALVVAEELEIARFAASLVDIRYETVETVTDLDTQIDKAFEPPEKRTPDWNPAARGDVDSALSRSPMHIRTEYRTPVEHHNPMETFASTAVWEKDGRLTIYDKTQGAPNCQQYLCSVFGLTKDKVRVLSPYVGGAFGVGLRPNYQLFMAALAAIGLKRSVRVTLTRQQMFTLGYRPQTIQTLTLGAENDGRLVAVKHDAIANTSRFEDYQEPTVVWSGALYPCDHSTVTSRLARLDLFTPCDMRAPGGAVGMYALESAMDELSYAVGVDPLELRLKNYSETDQNYGKPISSKALKDCYLQGAERFGWSKRRPQPRSMREGRELVGYGMATGIWEAFRVPTSARATLAPDGTLEIACATADIGTGTYTILAQIAAEMLGLPLDKVLVKIGDSDLPSAPVEGGSWTAASAGSAVMEACDGIRKQLLKRANAPLRGVDLADLTWVDGEIRMTSDPSRAMPLSEALLGLNEPLVAEVSSTPHERVLQDYSHYAHSAVFAEVRLDEELGMLRVTRVVSAIAAGRILNPKTARSQILGAVVGGIGMALHEETVIDHRYGRFMNHNLAEYHVPVHADVHAIDVIFVDEQEDRLNPLGVKGVGEIGIVGTAAAIANAVFHATGVRVRDLPITIDKLLELRQPTSNHAA
ncbi:xanthine dehydrogenase family protein molybdopterin-binding subunit [Methylocystis sp. SC2]|uniref:xanthine dehydrogenase family protein molybdopterin-binding subunit n=1 Tax=Methylocystis sp. (strain SC2) TaxID=187303 RepID=UPI00027AF15C|nr:xanthine dehydrogenase family protein molybdopterin-binding subunit [Methylocystis sp. SC2]CCJ08895.1 Aldehyde oxidase and xanthine dehydrogenase molybdopterin binding [Methylocystis sp. SC2]